jgi:zinc protease
MNRHLTCILIGTLACASLACPESEMAPVGPLVFPDDPFRAMQPAAAPARAFMPQEPQLFTLPGGAAVTLVERHNLPLVRWFITFPAGVLADPPGKEGLASLCATVMFAESKGLGRLAREQALADTGAFVDLLWNSYEITGTGFSLRGDFDATLQMWSDLVWQPVLDPNVFNAIKEFRMTPMMGGGALTPVTIAGRVSNRLFWGMGHPYTREVTIQSLGAITLPDCQAFAASLRPKGAQLYITGDVSRAEVEEKFGARVVNPAASPAAPAEAPPPMLDVPAPVSATGSLFFVDAPGAPQSIVTLRAPGPARSSEEYFATQVMGSILAGNDITGRIGMNVREMKGFAYSATGGFIYDKSVGYFVFSSPVVKDATAQSVFEVLEEIRRMREEDVTDEELARERDGLLAGFPYQFETGSNILNEYRNLAFWGLPFSYYQTYGAKFAAVTKASVREAAGRYLSPEKLQILVVGDGATVLPRLRELTASRPDLMGREVVTLDVRGNRI